MPQDRRLRDMGRMGIVHLCHGREVNVPGMAEGAVRDTKIEAEVLLSFCQLPAMDTVAHWC